MLNLSSRSALTSLSLMVLLAGSATAQSPQPASPVPPAPPAAKSPQPAATTRGPGIDAFMKIRTPASPTLAPDGTLYVRDWPDGVWQLYRVTPPQAEKGANTIASFEPGKTTITRLTDFKDGLAGYSLSPDGKRIVLAHAVGGNENTQLTLLDPAANGGKGSMTPILANPKVQASANLWSRDGASLYYSANDTSPADFHLYRWDFAADGGKGAATKVLAKEGSWSVQDATADGSRILVSKYNSASDSLAYELNPATGELKDLTIKGDQGTAANEIVGYAPDEKSVFIVSDHVEGIKRLYNRDLATAKVVESLPDLKAFELDGAGMNREKSLVVAVTNEDGYGVPHVYELPALAKVALPTMEKGVISVNDVRDRTLVWTLSNARTPGLAYSTTLPKAGAQLAAPLTRQLTFAETGGIDLAKFPLPELVKFTSFDGTPIPSFLWTPPGFKKGAPIPFVVNYHGGPEGQWRPGFDRTIQYLLSRGFGVLQPNVRGSTGYGRAFLMMDDYKKRWDSVKDGVEAARFLVKQGYAKAGKIAAYGGSYGGFMAVATIVEDGAAKEPVFGASIDVVGIVNMKTFLEQTASYRRKLREVEYGPLTDPDFLKSISPIEHIDRIKVPMMIAHGLNDPRVPVGEAMQLAVALQERGDDPELLFCPDEGHGFQKLRNRLIFAERMAKFLDEKIGK